MRPLDTREVEEIAEMPGRARPPFDPLVQDEQGLQDDSADVDWDFLSGRELSMYGQNPRA